MKISRRIFITLTSVSCLIGILTISYFVFLLPGLYADYKEKQLLQSVIDFHHASIQEEAMIQQGFGQTITVRIPLEEDTLRIITATASFDLVVHQPQVQKLLNQIRSIDNMETMPDFDSFDISIDFDELFPLDMIRDSFEIQNFEAQVFDFNDRTNSSVTQTQDDILILTSTLTVDHETYNNYLALSRTDEFIVITLSYSLTPLLNELLPIIVGSLPMIVLILLLVAIISSMLLTKTFARPVEALARQVENYEPSQLTPFSQPNKGDEFETLENALNQMSQNLNRTLSVLVKQNEAIKDASKRKELFLTNATHQLKTPLANAASLTQGLLNQVGKYKDPQVTLPLVLDELRKMNDLIHRSIHASVVQSYEKVDLAAMIQDILDFYQPSIDAKKLSIHCDLDEPIIMTDASIFASCLDNLISNAIKYTADYQTITIAKTDSTLTIFNEGSVIPEDLLPFIKEPFVRSHTQKEPGTGLGLMLVDLFLMILNYSWSIENVNQGVLVTIHLEENHDNHS